MYCTGEMQLQLDFDPIPQVCHWPARHPDGPEEGKAIQQWPQPTTIKDLQHCLGFANFYHHFIANYCQICTPLTSLLKNQPKSWSPALNITFNKSKEAFCTAATLVHLYLDLPFMVKVDASTTGVGAVLSGRVNHPNSIHVPSILHQFEAITDHRNLECLHDAKRLSPRQAPVGAILHLVHLHCHCHLHCHQLFEAKEKNNTALIQRVLFISYLCILVSFPRISASLGCERRMQGKKTRMEESKWMLFVYWNVLYHSNVTSKLHLLCSRDLPCC